MTWKNHEHADQGPFSNGKEFLLCANMFQNMKDHRSVLNRALSFFIKWRLHFLIEMKSNNDRNLVVNVFLKILLLIGIIVLPARCTAILNDLVKHSLYLKYINEFQFHMTLCFLQNMKPSSFEEKMVLYDTTKRPWRQMFDKMRLLTGLSNLFKTAKRCATIVSTLPRLQQKYFSNNTTPMKSCPTKMRTWICLLSTTAA